MAYDATKFVRLLIPLLLFGVVVWLFGVGYIIYCDSFWLGGLVLVCVVFDWLWSLLIYLCYIIIFCGLLCCY